MHSFFGYKERVSKWAILAVSNHVNILDLMALHCVYELRGVMLGSFTVEVEVQQWREMVVWIGVNVRQDRSPVHADCMYLCMTFCMIWHINRCPLLTRVSIVHFYLFFLRCCVFYHCNCKRCQQLFIKTDKCTDNVECFKDWLPFGCRWWRVIKL